MDLTSFRNSKYKLVILLLTVFIWSATILFNSCNNNTNNSSNIIHPNGKQFAGTETCKGCHKDIFESHSKTAHALSSRPGSLSSIKGSFDDGKNIFQLNPHLKVVMEKTDSGLFQAGYANGQELLRQPMDVVIGSGTKGQTYLYWYGNILAQLPISYYTPLGIWCNSPGYPDNEIIFNRVIPFRCLECHSTYAKTVNETNGILEYDKTKLILGINCERCHGPAADHVAYQINHPNERKAKFIINTALLSRQQQLDNCALCHSGLRENRKPAFSFVAGDTLDNFSAPDYKEENVKELDVHGNQYGLLTSSKCFKMSAMDCSSCHNVHAKETNNIQLFSQRCMNCHQEANHNFCAFPATKDLVLSDNCIDCHMPVMPTKKIFINVQDKSMSTPDLIRTHLIGIYKDQMKVYLQKIKKEKAVTKR